MAANNFITRIEAINAMIIARSTGNVEVLADKLNVSARTVFSDLQWMKRHGAPIRFARQYDSYIYRSEVTFIIAFVDPRIKKMIEEM